MSSQFYSVLVIEFPPVAYIDICKNKFLQSYLSVTTCSEY